MPGRFDSGRRQEIAISIASSRLDTSPERRFGITHILIVLLIGFLWGINWPAVKVMLTELPPLSVRAFAFPLAALCLAVLAHVIKQPLKPARRDWMPLFLTGFFLVFGFNMLTTFGQLMTETSRAAIIAYTMPAMTVVLAALFLGERLSRRGVLALLAGSLGLIVLAAEDFAGLFENPSGALVMLFAALSWAVGNILLKARQWSLSSLGLTFWFFVVAAFCSWPLVLIFEPLSDQTWPGSRVLWILAYHVAGPMSLCYALWTIMIARLPAGVVALSALFAPVVGVGSSMWLLGDTVTWQKLMSLGLVLVSIALTFSTTNRRSR